MSCKLTCIGLRVLGEELPFGFVHITGCGRCGDGSSSRGHHWASSIIQGQLLGQLLLLLLLLLQLLLLCLRCCCGHCGSLLLLLLLRPRVHKTICELLRPIRLDVLQYGCSRRTGRAVGRRCRCHLAQSTTGLRVLLLGVGVIAAGTADALHGHNVRLGTIAAGAAGTRRCGIAGAGGSTCSIC